MELNEVMIDYCFNFLNCTSLDDIKKIRKNYLYYIHYAEKYSFALYNEFYSNIDINDIDTFIKRKKDLSNLDTLIRLTHDTYLAILLYKTDLNTFKNIIIGLCSYFKCNYFKGGRNKIEPPLKEIMINNFKEASPYTKEKYLNFLESREHCSTHAGDYLITSSVGSIIEFEKSIIDEKEQIGYIIPNPEKKLIYKEWQLP